MAWHAAQAEQIREDIDHVVRLQLTRYADRQALTGELIEDIQHPVLATVMGAMLDEVVGPDMVRPLRPQAHARAVVEPEAGSLRLSSWNLEPLPPPDPFDPLHVDRPAIAPEQRGDPTVPIAPVLESQRDDGGGQCSLVSDHHGALTLCRTVLI